MKLYIVVLKHGSAKTDKPNNYRLWFGIEKNYEGARAKALDILKGYKILFFVPIKLNFDLIYLLPMFNRKERDYDRVVARTRSRAR